MPLQIDWYNSIIQVTSPTTAVDVQTLHDFIEDAMATPEGILYDDILIPEGKIVDPGNPGVYSQIIIKLSATWQIQFWQGSGYSRIYGGKIVGGVGGQPMKATGMAGDITVLESPVDGLAVGGAGGLTTEEHDALMAVPTAAENASAVWTDSEALLLLKSLRNKRAIVKNGSTWELIIYDDDNATPILVKALKDYAGANITDLVAGVMAEEGASSV